MSHHEPPRLARLLLHLQGLGSRRDEIDWDLRELFEIRAREHGVRNARSRATTATCVLGLAIAISVCTTVLSILNFASSV